MTSSTPPSLDTQNPPAYVAATEAPPPAYISPSLPAPKHPDDERLVAKCKTRHQPPSPKSHSSFRESRWFSTRRSQSRHETQSQSRNHIKRSDSVDPYATATYPPRPQSPPSQIFHAPPKPASPSLNTASSDSSHSNFSCSSQLGTPMLEKRFGVGWDQGYGCGGMYGKRGWITRTPGDRRQLSDYVLVALAFIVGIVILAIIVVVEKEK